MTADVDMSESKQARRHDELIAELLDSRIPKTEREHAASREIEALRAEVAKWKRVAAAAIRERLGLWQEGRDD